MPTKHPYPWHYSLLLVSFSELQPLLQSERSGSSEKCSVCFSLLLASARGRSSQSEFHELIRNFHDFWGTCVTNNDQALAIYIIVFSSRRRKCCTLSSPSWIDLTSFATPRRESREPLVYRWMHSLHAVVKIFLESVVVLYPVLDLHFFDF